MKEQFSPELRRAIATADALMAVFGLKRKAVVIDNVVYLTEKKK